MASPTFLLLSWPEPLACLPLLSSHRSRGFHLWSFLKPRYSPSPGLQHQGALGAPAGTALAPGSGCLLLWDPCSHRGQQLGMPCPSAHPLPGFGTEGHAQGRTCFPRRKSQMARAANPWNPAASEVKYPTGPWHSSPPDTHVLTRHGCSLHTQPAQCGPAVQLLPRRKGSFVDLRA